MPERKMVINDLPRTIEISVKTTGFEMLTHRFNKKEDSLVFDVESKIGGAKEIKKDIITIPTVAFAGELTEKLGNDYTVNGFYPDSIVFSFAGRSKKLVPVHLITKIAFEKQFDTTGHPVIIPDSVTISGPDSIIRSIQSVETVPLILSNLKSSVSANIKLKRDSLITASPDHVSVKIPIEKYTEGTTEVPVHVINVKPGYSLKTFPDKITVNYRVPLSRYNNINPAMFDAVADAAGLPNRDIQQLKINIISPDIVRMTVGVPEKADYILRKK